MSARAGIALLLTLMVLLLVDAMGVGMLLLATQARQVAEARARTARADAAARLAASTILSSWERRRFDTLTVGRQEAALSGADADASWSATVERLSGGSFAIRAYAHVGGSTVFSSSRAVALVRLLDSFAVLEQLNGALISSGTTVVAGMARLAAEPEALPPGWADSLCPVTEPLPDPAALATAYPPAIGVGVDIRGSVVRDSTLAVTDSMALPGVRWRELEDIADRREGGLLSPMPVVNESGCNTSAAGNWGDPARSGACADYFPLIYASGDLRMSGGTGQGILIVAGTLTMSGGATFVGPVIAGDGLILEPGSTVFGAVRSKGDLTLADDADLIYSRCAVARSLAGSEGARRRIPQRRTYLPAF